MLHSESISKPLIRTDVYLSETQRETMKGLARQQDVSMAELIRRVIDKHIRRTAAKLEAQK
jgi:hypothetical protein